MVKVERVEFAYVPVGSLVPFAGNPRRFSLGFLMSSGCSCLGA